MHERGLQSYRCLRGTTKTIFLFGQNIAIWLIRSWISSKKPHVSRC